MTKRLYVVQVEFEFAALAESPSEACHFTDQVVRDMSLLEDCAYARLISFHKFYGDKQPTRLVAMPPDGWGDDDLVYGADGDVTLGEAIEEERKIHDAEAKGE